MPSAELTKWCLVGWRKPECTDPMCAALVFEASYRAIKRRLMDRYWPGGWRLEPEEIAEIALISTTPARNILHQLAGENMLLYVPGQGFYVPRINETKLRGLFQLNLVLVDAAIKSSTRNSKVISTDGANSDQASNIFMQLGSRSGNDALAATISGLNDRLNLSRRCDSQLFNDVDSELEDIIAAANDDPTGAKFRRLIIRHHKRRIAKAAEYIRLMTSDLD